MKHKPVLNAIQLYRDIQIANIQLTLSLAAPSNAKLFGGFPVGIL